MEETRLLYDICTAMEFHISAIEQEDNPEVVSVHIEALEKVHSIMPMGLSVRESIRVGQGDFAAIQDKCLRMGLV